MGNKLEIPPPVVKKNKTEYLQELSNITEAELWIKKHSANEATTEPESRVIKVEQSNSKQASKWTPFETIFSIFLIILCFSLLFFSSILQRHPTFTLFFGLFVGSWGIWLRLKYSWLVNKMLIPIEVADIL